MNRKSTSQMDLFETFTVHCFWHCSHVVLANDPQSAHDEMEQHYREHHRAQITRVST